MKTPKNKIKNEFPLVYIEWTDAVSDENAWISNRFSNEWADNKEWIIKQVGFILKETKDYLLIAYAINPQLEDTKVCGRFKIPKSSIINRKKL